MEPTVVTNSRTCPVCGSEMKRDKTDNVHDKYTEHCTCVNHECGISKTFRN